MSRILFIVSSYYQLINAITLAMDKKDNTNSDLLLVKAGMNQHIDFVELKNKNIFAEVFDWHDAASLFYLVSKNKKEYFANNIKKLKTLFHIKKVQKSLPNYGEKYDEICIFYPDIVTRIVTAALTQRETQITFAEDGTFTYEYFNTTQSLFRTIIYRIWLKQDVKQECRAVYVHRRELVALGKRKIDIRRLPTELNRLKDVFSGISKQVLQYEDLARAKIIMFDQNLEYDEVLRRQLEIADIIHGVFKGNRFVVKLHPGTDKVLYSSNVQVNRIKIPFEIPMVSMDDLNDKVLVSIFSTACMNPKLMLNAEPIVIFTYKLVGLENLDFFDVKYLKILEKIKKLYRHKERVLVPETNEELTQILIRIENGEIK